jgi:sulfatase maturation enzyme AslB (radical SAM superfamily)
MSGTLCPLPWLSLSTESQRELRLCCHEDRSQRFFLDDGKALCLDQQGASQQELFNHPYYKEVRAKMLRGEIPKACQGCFKLEEETGDSPRTEYLDRFSSHFSKTVQKTDSDGTLLEAKTIYLDVTTDNSCNLLCRMCRPRYSKKIEEHWRAIGWNPTLEETEGISLELSEALYREGSIIDEVVQSVEMVTMTGGEPLLSPAVSTLLDRLIQSGRAPAISLRFFTNTTVYPTKLIQKLLQFQEVNFFCSIDGAGRTSDYIRYPSKWGTIENVFTQLVELSSTHPQVKVYLHTVIQAYNITQITQLFKFLKGFNGKTPFLPSMTGVESNLPLEISVLPLPVLMKAKDTIEKYFLDEQKALMNHHRAFHEREMRKLNSLLNEAISNNQSHRFIDFTIYSKKLDSLRGQSLLESYPEFKGK